MRLLAVRIIFSALAVICLAACAPKVKTTPPAPSPQPETTVSGYTQALKDWTRTQKLYRDFETTLLAQTTFKSRDFRKAYQNRYAEIYLLSTQERAKSIVGEEKLAQNSLDFILSLYIPEAKWNDLDHPDSVWKIYLRNNLDERIKPVDVVLLPQTPILRNFFPYVTDWSKVYRLRFDNRAPGASGKELLREGVNEITLTLTGVMGQVEFSWNLAATNNAAGDDQTAQSSQP